MVEVMFGFDAANGDDKTVFTLRTKLPGQSWRTVGERPTPPEFRGTGPMLDMKRNAEGVYEFIAG